RIGSAKRSPHPLLLVWAFLFLVRLRDYSNHSRHELEDENRELREKPRFKRGEYEFRTPFSYAKAHPDQPLCPKCLASNGAAPMGAPGQGVRKTIVGV